MDQFTRQTFIYIGALLVLAAIDVLVSPVPFLLYAAVHLVYLKLLYDDLRTHNHSRLWIIAVLFLGIIAAMLYLLYRSLHMPASGSSPDDDVNTATT